MDRRTFTLDRGLEYFTEAELAMQIGHAREAWPVAILKELIDNALDACESSGVASMITIEISASGFSVADNGPGIPEATVAGSLDYGVRVSNKLGYVMPTRGRLGNALMVTWAAPYVTTGKSLITVEAQGRRHEIKVGLDRIKQVPEISHEVSDSDREEGTKIALEWSESASLLEEGEGDDSYKSAAELVQDFAAFNPHATFILNAVTVMATRTEWAKSTPKDPLVAHWYSPETFAELIAHYVASERYDQRPVTVREFVSGFRGLKGTAKQKAVTEGLQGTHLSDLLADDGKDLDHDALGRLLARMKAMSRAPKPKALGVIGEDHIRTWMVEHGGAAEGSVVYRKKLGDDGQPYVIEVAFGVNVDDDEVRRLVTGLNWSPTLGVPVAEIDTLIAEQRLSWYDPVILLVHMARPSWDYTERGKGRVDL